MNRLVRKSLMALGLYDAAGDFKRWLTHTESKYASLYSEFVDEGDLCFDVGANVGRRTKVLLKLGARVVAIEPLPFCMDKLRRKYANNSNVILVEKAVGEKEEQAEMMISDTHSLSSLSKRWVQSVGASGRYSDRSWKKTVSVPVTTLDALIAQHGKPVFVKIDVEGYEYQVLRGLSQPISAICFEFHSEVMDSSIKGVKHLAAIGPAQFNYCTGVNPVEFVLPHWIAHKEMCDILESRRDNLTNGDIYAKFGLSSENQT